MASKKLSEAQERELETLVRMEEIDMWEGYGNRTRVNIYRRLENIGLVQSSESKRPNHITFTVTDAGRKRYEAMFGSRDPAASQPQAEPVADSKPITGDEAQALFADNSQRADVYLNHKGTKRYITAIKWTVDGFWDIQADGMRFTFSKHTDAIYQDIVATVADADEPVAAVADVPAPIVREDGQLEFQDNDHFQRYMGIEPKKGIAFPKLWAKLQEIAAEDEPDPTPPVSPDPTPTIDSSADTVLLDTPAVRITAGDVKPTRTAYFGNFSRNAHKVYTAADVQKATEAPQSKKSREIPRFNANKVSTTMMERKTPPALKLREKWALQNKVNIPVPSITGAELLAHGLHVIEKPKRLTQILESRTA